MKWDMVILIAELTLVKIDFFWLYSLFHSTIMTAEFAHNLFTTKCKEYPEIHAIRHISTGMVVCDIIPTTNLSFKRYKKDGITIWYCQPYLFLVEPEKIPWGDIEILIPTTVLRLSDNRDVFKDSFYVEDLPMGLADSIYKRYIEQPSADINDPSVYIAKKVIEFINKQD